MSVLWRWSILRCDRRPRFAIGVTCVPMALGARGPEVLLTDDASVACRAVELDTAGWCVDGANV